MDGIVAAWMFVPMGALFAILGIPLALGKVPPNWFYGFRTPKTLSRPEIWYEANRAFGVEFTIAGVAITLVAAVAALALGDRPAAAVFLDLGFVTAALAVVLARGFRHLRGL